MNFDMGDRSKFLSFVSNIGKEDTVVVVSHNDLDGLAAAKVVNAAVSCTFTRLISYEELTLELVEKIKQQGATKVIITDLFITNPSFIPALELFADVLIIDHHASTIDLNSEKTVFLKVEAGYCATYACYELFSEIKDISYLDWLVACACVSDYCHIKPSDWLSSIYQKYDDSLETVGLYVRQNGIIWDTQETISLSLIYFKQEPFKVYSLIGKSIASIDDLKDYASEIRVEIELLEKQFEQDKIKFKDGYYWEFTPRYGVTSLISSIISNHYADQTIILVRIDEDFCRVSARRQDRKQDMNILMQEAVKGFEGSSGGGHVPAAGAGFMRKDLETFKKRIGL